MTQKNYQLMKRAKNIGISIGILILYILPLTLFVFGTIGYINYVAGIEAQVKGCNSQSSVGALTTITGILLLIVGIILTIGSYIYLTEVITPKLSDYKAELTAPVEEHPYGHGFIQWCIDNKIIEFKGGDILVKHDHVKYVETFLLDRHWYSKKEAKKAAVGEFLDAVDVAWREHKHKFKVYRELNEQEYNNIN